jgi:hypothetical protein
MGARNKNRQVHRSEDKQKKTRGAERSTWEQERTIDKYDQMI